MKPIKSASALLQRAGRTRIQWEKELAEAKYSTTLYVFIKNYEITSSMRIRLPIGSPHPKLNKGWEKLDSKNFKELKNEVKELISELKENKKMENQ